MDMQNKEILFEIVSSGNLRKDVQKLRELGYVAGLLVDLTVKEDTTFLCIRYSDVFTEFIRNRKAGRHRKKEKVLITCGEVFFLKAAEGAKAAADTLGMPLATFYRRYNENKRKNEEDLFV